MPSRALTRDRDGRLPSSGEKLADVGLAESENNFAVVVAQDRDGRRLRGGDAVDEVAAGCGGSDGVIAGFGREGGEVVAVEVDAIEMREVGIVAGFAADGGEPDAARCGIDAQDLGDAAVAGGDLVLELAGAKVVEIEMAPVVALRVPEEFTRTREGSAS